MIGYLRPYLTEKSLAQSKKGRYTFVAPVGYSSHKIREAVEEGFNIKVAHVWLINRQKRKRLAVVSLKEGSPPINVFEAVSEKSQKGSPPRKKEAQI